MAVTCGFFNSLYGDRKYPADDISRIFDGVIRDGVYMSIGDKFAVTATTGMTINVGSGRAWFNHTWTLNDTDLPILMDDPDLVLDRIDAIVLEINRSEEVRNNTIKAVKGIASSNPQNPVMVNTEFIEQVPFAYITRKHGVTEIKTEDIKIVVGTSECPYVTSILEAADIDELFAQWDAQFGTWQNSKKEEFTTWFEGIRGQLEEDPAGHLQNQIDYIMNGQNVPNSGIAIYTHSRSGSVNELTGSGPNGRALITSDIQEGDTWTVNGSPVTAYVGTDDATSMMAGQPYTGRWVTFVFDGESVNFKGGGGPVTVEGLSADAVLAGSTVIVKQGMKTIQQVVGTSPKILSVGGYINNIKMILAACCNIDIPGFISAGEYKFIGGNSISFIAPSSGRKLNGTSYSATMTVSPASFSKGQTVWVSWESGNGGGGITFIEFD